MMLLLSSALGRSSTEVERSVGPPRWAENRPSDGRRSFDLAELWSYRELVAFLALRDVKARYKQALFGVSWAVIQPLLGAALFTFVFQRVAGISGDGVPYPLFALLGLTVWTYFTASLTSATNSLVSNASLVTKVYFPRLLAPLASLGPGLVGLAIGLVLVGAAMAYYGVAPSLKLLVLPLCVLAVMVVALGAGLLLATLNVRYRDVSQIFGLLTQLWLFASPVAYPTTLVPERWQWVYALNPMTGVLDGFRWAVLDAPAPGPHALISAGCALVLLLVGLRYFQRAERQFADVI
jgi:ABC-type polysaccharide/polyol phosphate export permease